MYNNQKYLKKLLLFLTCNIIYLLQMCGNYFLFYVGQGNFILFLSLLCIPQDKLLLIIYFA